MAITDPVRSETAIGATVTAGYSPEPHVSANRRLTSPRHGLCGRLAAEGAHDAQSDQLRLT